MRCSMDRIVLNVEDDERMLAFYTEVRQLAGERLQEYRAGTVPFPSVRLNANTIIDLFPATMWRKGDPQEQGRGRLNHFCLSMSKETWQQLLEQLRANAIVIEDGPVPRWGAHGTGTSIYFRDPEGNLIEARYYEYLADPETCLLGS